MGKKPELDKTEKDIFRSAMRGTKPLTHTKITPVQRPPRKSKHALHEKTDTNPFNLYDEQYPSEVAAMIY